jgi:3-phosphoinositide dependent protein kinase-1
VLDPAQRLGVGIPGSGNDMAALRSHPFFASIKWETLWIDPPPVPEPGLVKRVHTMGHDEDWDDVGAAWDDLVGSEGSDHDDLEWASDGEAPGYELRSNRYFNITETGIPRDEVDIGPLGETRQPVPLRRDRETTVHPTSRNLTEASTGMQGSSFSGSPPSSSSEGSPDVTRVIESISISERSSTERPDQTTSPGGERGRNQAMSPVQGNGTPNN